MIVQYLDKDGYQINPEEKPIFLRDYKKAPSMARVARYIRCPETTMLKWIGHCEDCKWFKNHVKYKGVKCSYKNTNNHGRKNNAPEGCRAKS